MTTNRPYVLWRRVSTKQQGESGLGLDAQQSITEYFMHGAPVKTFTDVYSGTKLAECPNLRQAIKYCKQSGYMLVVAKTDRFRNVQEALAILDEMGEGNICFCDLPTTDRTVLTMVFAIWERHALMGRINTKRGLAEARKRGVRLGRPKLDRSKGERGDNSAAILARQERAISWRQKSLAVRTAYRERAAGGTVTEITNKIGAHFDDFAATHPGEPNPYATPTGCKPSKGTISKWLSEANPLLV